jgi:hypothetical protein
MKALFCQSRRSFQSFPSVQSLRSINVHSINVHAQGPVNLTPARPILLFRPHANDALEFINSTLRELIRRHAFMFRANPITCKPSFFVASMFHLVPHCEPEPEEANLRCSTVAAHLVTPWQFQWSQNHANTMQKMQTGGILFPYSHLHGLILGRDFWSNDETQTLRIIQTDVVKRCASEITPSELADWIVVRNA